LEQIGRVVAPVPAASSLVTGYVFGKHGVATELLAGLAAGDVVLTTAFEGEVTASRDGDDWILDGETPFVPYGAEADVVAVPARFGAGPILALVRHRSPGVTVTELQTTNREPQATLAFDGVRVVEVIEDAGELVRELRQHMTAGLAMVAAGVCAAALE